MLFLVTNDDGFRAEGLQVLAGILENQGEVVVVAPEIEQSACSHSITLHRPLRVRSFGPNRYAVDGTPSDCVLLAGKSLLQVKPDVILSGINHGPNLGDDITYSGTVAGAFEGTLLGVRSIAVSSGDLERVRDKEVQRVLADLITRLLALDWPENVFFNVNLPHDGAPIKGIRVTKLGRRHYAETVIQNTDPRGRLYYWIGGENPRWYGDKHSDFRAVHDGYISVTPLHLDLTHYPSLDALRNIDFGL